MNSIKPLILFSLALLLSACSKKDYDTDGKKVADLLCKASNMQKKALENPSNSQLMLDATNLTVEGQLLLAQLQEKYKTQDEKNKLAASYLSEVEKCKQNDTGSIDDPEPIASASSAPAVDTIADDAEPTPADDAQPTAAEEYETAADAEPAADAQSS